MEHKIKCMHCHTATSLVFRTVKSKFHGAKILLDNAPMYYCPQCNDSLISIEAIEALKYIKTLPLKQVESNIFDYNIIKDKVTHE
jgi:YgiT-type zinc finger domain-containing protein